MLRPNSRLVVRPHVSGRQRLLLGAAALAVVTGLAYATYRVGLHRAGFLHDAAVQSQRQSQDRISTLEVRVTQLRETLARAERQLQIDRVAYRQLDDSLQESTQELARLRQELNFYSNIISPKDERRGVQIQDLKIEKTGVDERYRYKLVLIQSYNHKRIIKGRIKLEVLGIQGGEEKLIPVGGQNKTAISFRYFQNLEGTIDLPGGFAPMRVKVSVSTDDKKRPRMQQWYNWPQA